MIGQQLGRRLRAAVAAKNFGRHRSFGLNRLDLKVAAFVGKKGGFFIEAGANDGISQSNTLYLERYKGWTGILIEPIPKLCNLARRNRPNASVYNHALVPLGYDKASVSMTYCNLMSLVNGARGSESADQQHIARGSKFLEQDDRIEAVDVSCRTLTDIIEDHGAKHIDLLVLDVEGFEVPALRGLDFDRFAPDWILVEANEPAEIEAVLRPRYEFHVQLSHHDNLYRLR